ncbi:MAG: alpha/beta hydrolase [Halobacteriales archaeon]|nr:alpha/beta hydrolase [Halobacteriales archaeon]
MATVRNGEVRLHYRADGEGDRTIVFIPDAGCGAWQWAWQAPAIAGPVETLVYYPRGTGPSDSPPGPYPLDALVGDLEAILADHGASNVTLVGAGFGGVLALEHAHHSSRPDRIVVLGAGAVGAQFQLDPLFAGADSIDGLLGGPFVDDRPADVERIVGWRRDEDAVGPAASAYREALRTVDLSDRLVAITDPTLVLHGTVDGVVSPDHGRSLAENLPRGTFEPIEGGQHWFFIEQARRITDRIAGFLPESDRES